MPIELLYKSNNLFFLKKEKRCASPTYLGMETRRVRKSRFGQIVEAVERKDIREMKKQKQAICLIYEKPECQPSGPKF
jgi:hypothetical protein